MSDRLYLAWRYLAFHRWKTAILVASLTLILFVPVALRVLVRQSEQQLTSRADATPLLVGKKGSPLELVLSSLYFGADVPATVAYAEVARVRATGFADAIPLSVRFRAGSDPIVGTSLAYFDFRGLRIADGKPLARLGDCVLGARVAAQRGIGPGDHVMSTPEEVFDLAGVYPLKMRVVGVLSPSDGPDDHAVFVDVKTAWVIEGLAHGHDDLATSGAGVLKKDGSTLVANASVVQFNEVTDTNLASFHFHGDAATFPITAVLALPRDSKAEALLRGRYQSDDEPMQILVPSNVLGELLDTVLTVQRYVVVALAIVGVATLMTATLVFLLSLRIRRREIETMLKIGGSRGAIAWVVSSEIVGVLVASAVLAGALTLVTRHFGADAFRAFVT